MTGSGDAVDSPDPVQSAESVASMNHAEKVQMLRDMLATSQRETEQLNALADRLGAALTHRNEQLGWLRRPWWQRIGRRASYLRDAQ